MLELEIECIESSYFIRGDDSQTFILTFFVSFILKHFVIRHEETVDKCSFKTFKLSFPS